MFRSPKCLFRVPTNLFDSVFVKSKAAAFQGSQTDTAQEPPRFDAFTEVSEISRARAISAKFLDQTLTGALIREEILQLIGTWEI